MMTTHWQEWIVALLVLLCIIRIGMSVISFFHPSKKERDPCSNCPTGCEIKKLYDKKRLGCLDKAKG